MAKCAFKLDLEETSVGDIVFIDHNGMQIQSNNAIIENGKGKNLAKSWNLSNTGSFEMNGLKIKNGIKESPSNIKDDRNILQSVEQLEFLNHIGKGATGSVRKAKHLQRDEVLAIKCIDFGDRNARKQFHEEISHYLNFDHPHIVPFRGCCINFNTEQLYLALEYCSNGSLHSFVAKHGTFTEAQCKKMSVEMISALSYLEFNKIIHRDVKPQNILLDDKLTAKMADFGIQKCLDGSNWFMDKTCSLFAKTQIGTVFYMSPERMMGKMYSYKSDIWSFGLTILFCVYGCFPYNRENKAMSLIDMHIAIVEEEVPTLPETDKNGKEFSMEFKSFVQACLYKDQNKRWKASDLLMHPFLIES